MMTERRYGFRFSGAEGGLLIGSVLLASFLIFVSGVYVGREVAGRKIVPQPQIVRAPVAFSSSPVATRPPTITEPAPVRTASVNPPVTWPVAREKIVPPAPPLARSDIPTEKEKDRMEVTPSRGNEPMVTANPLRVPNSPSVSDYSVPQRTKPTAEPFLPKVPVAAASRTEKTTTAASRGENGDKKPVPITVAHVEKAETPARPRALALETKRSSEGKSSEAKPTQEATKKTAKQLAGWRVQVGATTYQETAQDMARELRELGYSPLVSAVQMNGETLYRVRIGKFGKQGEAVAAVGRFRREGRFSQAYLVSE